MGELAKRLGQLASRSLETESGNIIKTVRSNKRGLSKALDGTLRNAHDMKIFGLGTAASMASRQRYARFTTAMHHVYSAMETQLDANESPPVRAVWQCFGDKLRRAEALQADLEEVGAWSPLPLESSLPSSRYTISPATVAYVDAIAAASRSDSETGGGRLLAHVYVRYFADLFGGQALSGPYRLALGLDEGSPKHFDFGSFGTHRRRESIESMYAAINAAGDRLSEEECAAVVAEARLAFAHNVDVYSEEGRLIADGARGALRIVTGFARKQVQQQQQQQ